MRLDCKILFHMEKVIRAYVGHSKVIVRPIMVEKLVIDFKE